MELRDRMAVISEIVRRKENKNGRLGKTAMMKLLHILQDGFDVPLGYRFSLYNYGPYDTEVMSDIDFAQSLDLVNVQYLGEDKGYEIEPSNDAARFALPASVATASLDDLIDNFGELNARELELRSTLLFLSSAYRGDQLVERLRELKPKYSATEARRALDELIRLELVSV